VFSLLLGGFKQKLDAWRCLLSLRYFYGVAGRYGLWLAITSILLIILFLSSGLWWSPTDYQQGDAYRIMYLHVPCAALSLGVYALMGVFAIISMVWRIKLADVLLEVLVPLGLTYTMCALVTGSIWGKPIWGTWWMWDARLTSELILAFIYLGIMLLRGMYDLPQASARPCALLTIVGLVNLPIIHYSVRWWHTLHQPASILAWQRPTIALSMLWPLLGSMLGFALLGLAWVLWRSRISIVQREWRTQWVQAIYVESMND
jgi:heme exporter protein C